MMPSQVDAAMVSPQTAFRTVRMRASYRIVFVLESYLFSQRAELCCGTLDGGLGPLNEDIIPLIRSQASGRITSRYVSRCPNPLSGPQASVASWTAALNVPRYPCSEVSCTPWIRSCTTNTNRKIAVV